MTMTKLVRDDIPSTQENLMKWALDNGYSPVTSYTMVPVANRFHLRLENNGKYDVFCLPEEAVHQGTAISMCMLLFSCYPS